MEESKGYRRSIKKVLSVRTKGGSQLDKYFLKLKVNTDLSNLTEEELITGVFNIFHHKKDS